MGKSVSHVCLLLLFTSILFASNLYAKEKKSKQAKESNCVACHKDVTPGVVKQWKDSVMGKQGVSCEECHGSAHQNAGDFAKVEFPTPDTCGKCHENRVKEFRDGKHSLGWIAMEAMPMVTHQSKAIVGEGLKGCAGCHKIGDKPEAKMKELKYGKSGCDSCHTRHAFSVKEAKNPRACQTCHMGFDHPQWEMWSTSKHGTIWQIEGDTGRAPTCQDCHMEGGNHTVMTSWGFLALRLPEEDKDWLADRVEILKALGVLDENTNPTDRFEVVKEGKVARLTKEDFDKEREKMINVCGKCHSKNFAKQQLEAGDQIIKESDKVFAEAIRVVKELYDSGLLKKPDGWRYAPDLLQFYEAKSSVEQDLYLMFLEYRMRAFQGAFHSNPDYMHWYGWAPLKETLVRIKEEAEKMKSASKSKK